MRINCSHNGKVQEIGQDPALFLCIYGGSTSLRFGFNLKPAFTQSQDSSLWRKRPCCMYAFFFLLRRVKDLSFALFGSSPELTLWRELHADWLRLGLLNQSVSTPVRAHKVGRVRFGPKSLHWESIAMKCRVNPCIQDSVCEYYGKYEN
jgi:hypothetical protein